MRLLIVLAVVALQATSVQVRRFPQNPILTPASDVSIGDNINGPSLIRVPDSGPTLIPADAGRLLRHAAVELRGDVLRVYYSRIGDRPERILLSESRLTPDWLTWRASPPVDVLKPEQAYEGADRPLDTSAPDEAPGRVRQLRDPGIFVEGGKTYLLYSIAGESGIAIGELLDR